MSHDRKDASMDGIEQLGLTEDGDEAGEARTRTIPTENLPPAEPSWLTNGAQDHTTTPGTTGPRIRWAGIVWGLLFLAGGLVTAWTLVEPGRRRTFAHWLVSLNGGSGLLAGALALGGLLLVIGITSALKAASRNR